MLVFQELPLDPELEVNKFLYSKFFNRICFLKNFFLKIQKLGAGLFDPLNQAARGASGSPGLDGRKEETPEDKIKVLEKKVNELIEESCFAGR